MRIRNTLTALAFTAVLVAGAVTAGGAAAQPAASGCGWTLVDTPPVPGSNTLASSPLPGASIVTPAYGSLYGVDAHSSGNVRIAGDVLWPTQAGWLLQGSAGSVTAASPQLPGVPLAGSLPTAGPSFDSKDDGWVLTAQLGAAPDVERWHDGRWTLVQMAPLTGDHAWPQYYTGFDDVVSLSPSDAWAAGRIFRGLASVGTIIQHWDGASWQVVAQPLADQASTALTGISAVSPNDIWVVGDQRNDAGVLVPVTEHWDGRSWSLVPAPSGNADTGLLAVSASGPSDVWAVGDDVLPGSDGLAGSLVEHYDGTTWQTVKIPDIGNSKLTGVYASGPDDVWAIGQFAFGLNQVFLHWDGHTWSPVAVPGPSKYYTWYQYNAIDGSGPGDVWAVGEVDDYGNQTTYPAVAQLRCRS